MKTLSTGWTIGGFLPYTLPREMAAELVFPQKFSSEDEKWMFVALNEGMKGCGISNPNPSVGCVIVKGKTETASGCTEAYKLRHAERVACEKQKDLSGCTAYITLEPCFHQGHQPPCVDLLIEKKISRVVIAHEDPNPKVNGESIRKLRSKGIEVSVGVLKNEAALWHLPFLASQTLKRPVFAGKWAQTKDGLLADDLGESKWITGPKSRAYSHWLRQKYDAVMVGAGTFLKDQPKLTVRDCREPVLRQPLKVIVDLKGKIKNTPDGFELLSVNSIEKIQEWAQAKNLQSIFVEGGAGLLNLFLKEDALDIIHQFTGEKKLLGKKHKVDFTGKGFLPLVDLQIEKDRLQEYIKNEHQTNLLIGF